MAKEEATRFRAIAARLNYMTHDRPDIAVAAMRLCSRMAEPTRDDWAAMMRVGRYLIGLPRVCYRYGWQSPQSGIEVFSDSDWAGDRATRRSTSGGAIYHGNHLIRAWAKKQAVISLSSAEAELYAACKAASEALGTQAYLRDLGAEAGVQMHMDSSSALSLTSRAGLGKAKHIDIQWLWIQEAVEQGRIRCQKVPGDSNPADLLTKHMAGDRIRYLMELLGFRYGSS